MRVGGDVSQSVGHLLAGYAQLSILVEHGHGMENGVHVLGLVYATKFAVEHAIIPCFIVHSTLPEDRSIEHLWCILCKAHLDVEPAGRFLKHGPRFFIGFTHHGRYARLHDTCFLSGNFGTGVAQELGVVNADVGDDGKDGGDDVGAVEPSSQSHFDDSNIHLLLGEIVESHGRGQFKETGPQRFEKRPFILHKSCHIFLVYADTVHPDALSEITQMRRGIKPHFISRLLQYRGQRVRTRALAVGAGNVYAGIFPVRMSKMLIQTQGVVQSLMKCRCPRLLKHGYAAIQIVKCLFVGHDFFLLNCCFFRKMPMA